MATQLEPTNQRLKQRADYYRRKVRGQATGKQPWQRIVDKWPAKQIPYKDEPRMIPATDLIGNVELILATEQVLHDIHRAQGVQYDEGCRQPCRIANDYTSTPILPPRKPNPKLEAFLTKRGFLTWLVNHGRRRIGLPDIDAFGNVIDGTDPATVKAFGAVLAAIQKRHEERIGQLWLITRHKDQDRNGSDRATGGVTYDELRALQYTSWANLRGIIRKGIKAGYFWKRGDQLRYRSEAGLALMLGIESMSGWAVSIPVMQLMESDIKALRALFDDAFISSRGDGFTNPIARGGYRNDVGIKRATGRTRPTQRTYEALRGIDVRPNYQDFGIYTPERLSRLRHEDRQPAFILRQRYGARIVKRLSNAYRGTLQTVKRGRRWLNWRIKQLMDDPGHRCNKRRSHATSEIRRYYEHEQPAIKAADDGVGVTVYVWDGLATHARYGIWQGVL